MFIICFLLYYELQEHRVLICLPTTIFLCLELCLAHNKRFGKYILLDDYLEAHSREWCAVGSAIFPVLFLPVDFALGDFMEISGSSGQPNPLSRGVPSFMTWIETPFPSRNPQHSKYSCVCYENGPSNLTTSIFCVTR